MPTELADAILPVGNKRLKAGQISCYVDPEIKQALEAWAEKDQRSLSNLAAVLLTNAVRDRLHTTTAPVLASAQGAPSDGQ